MDIFVSRFGSDKTGNGSSLLPYKTLKYAKSMLKNDGILYIHNTYFDLKKESINPNDYEYIDEKLIILK